MSRGPAPKPAAHRIAAKVVVAESGCWISTVTPNAGGYATVEVRSGPERRALLAHRVMYEVVRGPIPAGHDVHHQCETSACVNPFHVETTPHNEHGRHHMPRNPICVACGQADWYERPDGRRDCRECKRRRRRASRIRRWEP